MQIKAFLADYSNALDRANQFDAQVEQDAKKISQDYADLVALSMRQGFAATEITVARNGGSYDTSNVLTFLKGPSLIGMTSVRFSTFALTRLLSCLHSGTAEMSTKVRRSVRGS